MSSLNMAQIIGNLTRDPELRQTPSGANVATLSVATNRKWKGADGTPTEEVEYHSVVIWNRLAEIAGQYLKKGSKVYFEGRLKTRSWEDPDGKKNYRTEIVAENMVMLDSRGAAPAAATQEAPSAPPPEKEEKKVSVDDLPF